MALADNLGLIFEGLKIDLNNAYHIWFEAFVFSFRIYFDFAGYSMVALGLGRLFGVKLTLNFLSPYFSRNIKEFWRRWHVSLSSWLRDYVYFPIGGNRRGYWFVNVLIVFIVSGIWHGAGWGFIIWGFLHGIGVVFVSQNRGVCLPKALGTIVTFIFVTFTWIFFYERDSSLIQGKVLAVCDLRHYGREAILALPKIFGSGSDLVLALLILGISSVVLAAEGWSARRTELESYDFLKKTSVQVLQIFSIVLLAPMTQSGFIYFNF